MRAISHWVFRTFGFEPWRFHHHLHTTGSVVAGSAALAALFPRRIRSNNMDIYVPQSTAGDLLHFLQEDADYKPMLGPFYQNSDFQWKNLLGFLPLASLSTKTTINVYIAESSALFSLISNRSTTAMNLITGQHVSLTNPRPYV